MPTISRRAVILPLTALTAGLLTAPSAAVAAPGDEAGVTKSTFIEDYHDSMPAGDDCGFSANVYEDRTGSYDITLHTRGQLAGTAHIVGHIDGHFVLTPTDITDTRSWTGSYQEVDSLSVDATAREDTIYKTATFHLISKATGTDGSSLRLKLSEHLVMDTKTGEVQHVNDVALCEIT